MLLSMSTFWRSCSRACLSELFLYIGVSLKVFFLTWNKILETNRFILFSEHNLNMDSCYECKKCQFFSWFYSIVKHFLGTFSQRSPFQKDCKSKLSLQSNKYVICFHSKHVVCQKKPWIDVFESTIVKIAKP